MNLRSRLLHGLGFLVLVFLAGCTRTHWLPQGEYHALLASPDSTGTLVSYMSGDEADYNDETGLCDLHTLTLGFPGAAVVGAIAAFKMKLPKGPCKVGSQTVTGGWALIYRPTGDKLGSVMAKASKDWTVTGTFTVTEYTDFHPGEPAVGENVLSERAKGTFSIEAHGPDGAFVNMSNGTFTLDMRVEKNDYNPFD